LLNFETESVAGGMVEFIGLTTDVDLIESIGDDHSSLPPFYGGARSMRAADWGFRQKREPGEPKPLLSASVSEWMKGLFGSTEYLLEPIRPDFGEKGMYRQPILGNNMNPQPSKGVGAPRRRSGRMVLCLGDLPNVAVIERYFQERGWRVHLAETGGEARLLVREHEASVALLAEEQPNEESGWLTCWKLLNEAPETQVIVLGASHAERGARRAAMVGAAYVRASEPVASIYRTLHPTQGSVV
jgi:CheY-like chemotaxis protein